MLKRLSDLRLIEYTPYRGVELTEAGKRVALEVVRHHRLLELYLAEHVGYSWDEVDAEAERLEHVISEEFEARIDALLGFPNTDPHGDPIPTKEGHIHDEKSYIPLAECQAGQQVVVRRVSDQDPARLREFGRIGLFPSAQLAILSSASPEGLISIRIGKEEYDVHAEDARSVFVENVSPQV